MSVPLLETALYNVGKRVRVTLTQEGTKASTRKFLQELKAVSQNKKPFEDSFIKGIEKSGKINILNRIVLTIKHFLNRFNIFGGYRKQRGKILTKDLTNAISSGTFTKDSGITLLRKYQIDDRILSKNSFGGVRSATREMYNNEKILKEAWKNLDEKTVLRAFQDAGKTAQFKDAGSFAKAELFKTVLTKMSPEQRIAYIDEVIQRLATKLEQATQAAT